ncbi:uncharacterized [Tachysurus ichikawai]
MSLCCFSRLWDCLVDRDRWELLGQRDVQDIVALKEEKAWPVHPGSMGYQVCQVCQENLVLKDRLHYQGVNQGQEDTQDLQVHPVPWEHRAPLEMRVIQDPWVLLAQGVQMVFLENLVKMVNQENQERKEKTVFQDQL